jgi:hypothetical protein
MYVYIYIFIFDEATKALPPGTQSPSYEACTQARRRSPGLGLLMRHHLQSSKCRSSRRPSCET